MLFLSLCFFFGFHAPPMTLAQCDASASSIRSPARWALRFFGDHSRMHLDDSRVHGIQTFPFLHTKSFLRCCHFSAVACLKSHEGGSCAG